VVLVVSDDLYRECPENVGGWHIYRFKDGAFRCRCGKSVEEDK